MTKEEFLAVTKHDRLKYIGTKPLHEVLKKDPKDVADIWTTKGLVVQYTGEDTIYDDKSGWYSRKAVGKELSISYYGGYVRGIDPAEWILAEKRAWVQKDTEYKNARAYVKRTCSNFKHGIRGLLGRYKSRIDWTLDRLPLDKKLMLIMEMDNEYKKWFGIINMDPEEAMKSLEKTFEGDDVDTNGQSMESGQGQTPPSEHS